MDTLEKERELVRLIDLAHGEERAILKKRLNKMLLDEIELRRAQDYVELKKTELAIDANM